MQPLDSNRPSCFKRQDGRVSFRPSELGKCSRGLTACLLGMKPEEFTQDQIRVMKQGAIHEPHIAHDFEVEYGGYVQRQVRCNRPIGSFAILEGTCDGVWFPEGLPEECADICSSYNVGPWHDPRIIQYNAPFRVPSGDNPEVVAYGFEAKASDDSMFDEMLANGPTENYKMQLSCYWHMLEFTLGITLCGYVFAVGRRRDGLRHYRIIESPYYSLGDIHDRCLRILNAAEEGIGHDGSIDCDEALRYGCKWWKVHKRTDEFTDHKAADAKGYELDSELFKVGIQLYEVQAQLDRLKKQEEGLRSKIQDGMRGRQKISAPGFRVYINSKKNGDDSMTVRVVKAELEPFLKQLGIDQKPAKEVKPKKTSGLSASQSSANQDYIKSMLDV